MDAYLYYTELWAKLRKKIKSKQKSVKDYIGLINHPIRRIQHIQL